MRKTIAAAVMVAMTAFVAATCGTTAPAAALQEGSVRVSLDFERQGGIASNQFAVWVEDADGGYIRTLYATRWTAAGGWQRREMSLPLWSERSGLAGRSREHVDALAGPTPRSGSFHYYWDGRDHSGAEVPPGEYRILVEASLRWEDRSLHTAVLRLGESGTAVADVEFFGERVAERGMVGSVTVTF